MFAGLEARRVIAEFESVGIGAEGGLAASAGSVALQVGHSHNEVVTSTVQLSDEARKPTANDQETQTFASTTRQTTTFLQAIETLSGY
jgi:hypothetical protein